MEDRLRRVLKENNVRVWAALLCFRIGKYISILLSRG
jgi:hypothetical protein